METFGQRLKALRNGREISQNELSKYIGVSKSSVNMYERDEREPGFETLEAIADFFNVNMDYLLGRETHISASVTSRGLTNIIQFDEKQFSASAQPTLIKFVAAINASDSPKYLSTLVQVVTEMEKTFTHDDYERLIATLESCPAYEGQSPTPLPDMSETPPEGK